LISPTSDADSGGGGNSGSGGAPISGGGSISAGLSWIGSLQGRPLFSFLVIISLDDPVGDDRFLDMVLQVEVLLALLVAREVESREFGVRT